MKSNEWQAFFDGHAPVYMENVFTRNTQEEIEFLIAELGIGPGARILDVGCGTGRHAVELARRGYLMTGIDISEGMLREAARAAEEAGVSVELIQADASRFSTDMSFDAAICLCEGGFGLLGSGDDPLEHDQAILANVFGALKPGGLFVLTVLSALSMMRRCTPEQIADGCFDPQTLSVREKVPAGDREVEVRERGFTVPELRLMLLLAGFEVEHTGGGTAGNWGKRPLELDEYEIMAIARKPGSD
jgi:cyclopropane fatty-acyl-phospholipid synthase-like methyltransferase